MKAKRTECKSARDFEKDFARKFGGRRVLKTAFHFFFWAAKGDSQLRDRLLHDFVADCRRAKVSASWRRAAEWYERADRRRSGNA